MSSASRHPHVDPSTIPHRPHSVGVPSARPTSSKLYEAERLARDAAGEVGRILVMPKSAPLGVRLVPDADGIHKWTDPYGAAVLAGVSRRTIYAWKTRGWLKIRYMASAKMEIRVDSLWWSPEEREAAASAGAVPDQTPRVLLSEDDAVDSHADAGEDTDAEIDTE